MKSLNWLKGGKLHVNPFLEALPQQRVKNTSCPVKINLNEQEDGSWEVTTCILEHVGHPVSSKVFYSHQQSKKLDDDDKEFVKGLLRVRANPRNIADVLRERTGGNALENNAWGGCFGKSNKTVS